MAQAVLETQKTFSVLIVDDEPEIREPITKYLATGHSVYFSDYNLKTESVASADEALTALANKNFDLVISDIKMKGMNGIDLLYKINLLYPDVSTALITAYPVEDYINMAKKYNITNIITKTAPFNFQEFSQVIDNLLIKQNVFGLHNYLRSEALIHETSIATSNDIDVHINQICTFCKEHTPLSKNYIVSIKVSISEAVLNSIIHAQSQQEQVIHQNMLAKHAPLKLTYGKDHEKFGIGIVDFGGKLTTHDILFWLDRNINDDNIIFEEHGRGLYIMRLNVDRVIFNIKQDALTEVILLKYFTDNYIGHKPLYINHI